MHQNTSSKIYFVFLAIILIWGFSWPMNKIGIQYMHPIWFAALRLIIGTLSMFILVGMLGKLFLPTRKDMSIILTIGLLQMGLFTTLINLGLNYVDAGRSAILTYTTPLWVMPLAILFFNEKASYLKWLGFILGMAGVIVLFNPWSIDWSRHDVLMGNGMLLLAALSLAISMICARNIRWTRSPLELLPWQLLVGTIPVSLLAAYSQPHPIIEWNDMSIVTLAYTGFLGTAMGNWAATVVSKGLPSITVSLGFLGVPISGLLFSTLILDEAITSSIQIALIFIPTGIICVALGNRDNSITHRQLINNR